MPENRQTELRVITSKPIEEQPILLGALLSELFEKRKVKLTIVGGAAVQFYTQADYVTNDLDAVLSGDSTADIEAVLGGLGFKRATTYRHFEHPLFNFVVEFPPSPVAVGNRHISQVALIQTNLGPVRIIRIEDLIMDRIIAGTEWRSQESLDQARLLWIKHQKNIDSSYLTEFAKQEGYLADLRKVTKPVKKR